MSESRKAAEKIREENLQKLAEQHAREYLESLARRQYSEQPTAEDTFIPSEESESEEFESEESESEESESEESERWSFR